MYTRRPKVLGSLVQYASVIKVMKLGMLFRHLQDEVHRSRQLLQEKEQQLSQMVSSLQLTAAQVLHLHRMWA